MKHSTFLVHHALLVFASSAVHSVKLAEFSLGEELTNTLIQRHSGAQYQQPVLQPDDRHDVPLHQLLSAQYHANIKIGSEDKTYKVIVDTSISYILMSSWSTDDSNTVISARRHFQKAEAKTHQANIKIGDIEIKDQEYFETDGGLFGPVDGIFGLCYATEDDSRSPIYNMIEQGLIDEPLFAVSLGDDKKKRESTLTLGGIDGDHYTGAITYLPTTRKGYWEIQLDSLTFDEEVVSFENTTAVLDTGTRLFALPSSLADLLNRQIGVKADSTVDCSKRNSQPDLTFTLAGHEFVVTAQDYILEIYETLCISAVMPFDVQSPSGGPLVVLGDAFLRKWYSVYNVGNNTIGLAKAA